MRKTVDWVRLGLLAAGLGISFYLTLVHYAGAPLVCKDVGIIDCVQVVTSPQSVVLGLPIAVWGLVWFAAAIGLWCWRAPRSESFRLGWTLVGTASVLYFIYLEFIVIGFICMWCTATHIIVLTLLTLAILQPPRVDEVAGAAAPAIPARSSGGGRPR